MALADTKIQTWQSQFKLEAILDGVQRLEYEWLQIKRLFHRQASVIPASANPQAQQPIRSYLT